MSPRRLLLVVASCLTLSLFAGCGHLNLWGAKNTGNPASFGGNVSIPLGK